MSDLIVPVSKIKEIRPHNNADTLEIAVVDGWQLCVPIGNHKVGDEIIYFAPDCMIKRSWAVEFGVDKYLSWTKRYSDQTSEEDSPNDYGRVRAVKLRGEYSYGFIVDNKWGYAQGANVAVSFGVKKWEPPVSNKGGGANQGSIIEDHPLFHKYTNIQNGRYFPEDMVGREVIVTEKCHGSNSRISLTLNNGKWEIMIGSHNRQRANPDNYPTWKLGFWKFVKQFGFGKIKWEASKRVNYIENMIDTIYHYPLQLYPQIKELLEDIRDNYTIWECGAGRTDTVILYGEIYGYGVQDLQYGLTNVDYVAFDISINGNYINRKWFYAICEEHDIPTVPVLYEGTYDFDKICELASGLTTMMDDPTPKDLREGVVVTTIDSGPRMIYKIISPEYLTRKEGTEYH